MLRIMHNADIMDNSMVYEIHFYRSIHPPQADFFASKCTPDVRMKRRSITERKEIT